MSFCVKVSHTGKALCCIQVHLANSEIYIALHGKALGTNQDSLVVCLGAPLNLRNFRNTLVSGLVGGLKW